MDYLKQPLNFVAFIVLGCLVVSFIVQIVYYLTYYRVFKRRSRSVKKGKVHFSTEQPPVSVIICARNEAANLETFLPLFLEQDYPEFQVVVVNDGSWDDSVEILKKYALLYPNLYYTSLPEGTKIVSHKKLAVTVGIKAAKYDTLLFSDADCRPLTSNWISLMVRNFTDGHEFVLGYGAYARNTSLLSKMISFDTQFIAMQYLGFAYAGVPYMAVGRNMAYKKDTFFKIKGFAGTLHIASGDDDLLVNKGGNKQNTAIETALESLTVSIPKETFKDWLRQKRRHLTTSSIYTSKSKRQLSIELATRTIFYLSLVLAIVLCQPLLWIIACALFLARWIIQMAVFNSTARYLKERTVYLTLILWDIFLPLINLYLLSLGRFIYKLKHNNW